MGNQQAKIVYLTGKGGTGKSTIAAALADAAAQQGLATIVVRLGPAPRRSMASRALEVCLDDASSLTAFVKRTLPFGLFADRILQSRTFAAAAAAAPGLKELVTLSRILDLADGADGPVDVLVIDGPSTGHGLSLLSAPESLTGLFPMGPAFARAHEIQALMTDRRHFRVVLTTAPAELPVWETNSLVAELEEQGFGIDAIVASGVYPERCNAEQVAWLRQSGVAPDAILHSDRRRRQVEVLGSLEVANTPLFIVPFCFDSSGSPLDATGTKTASTGILKTILEGP